MSDEQLMDQVSELDLVTRLADVILPNPVLTAAGCAGTGRELDRFFDIAELGAIVTETVTVRPRAGFSTPRMAETPSGVLNSTGQPGPGIDEFLDSGLLWLAARGARIVVNIAGESVAEYAELTSRLRDVAGVVLLELNLAWPNAERGGQLFSRDATAAGEVVRAARQAAAGAVPILAKLSADVTDIVQIAQSCVDSGVSGLSLINTVAGMAIDTDSFRPVLAAGIGGLSGPAIRPIALRCVWQVRQALPQIPILAAGGIMTGLDALQFLLAGASAVSVGTATFHDPHAPQRIRTELAAALEARGVRRCVDVVGLAHRSPTEPVTLPKARPPVNL